MLRNKCAQCVTQCVTLMHSLNFDPTNSTLDPDLSIYDQSIYNNCNDNNNNLPCKIKIKTFEISFSKLMHVTQSSPGDNHCVVQ